MTSMLRRAVTVGVFWLLAVVALVAAEMRPSPIPLAAIAAAIGAAVYVLVDLVEVAEPASWRVRRDAGGLGRGADARIHSLQRQLERPHHDGDHVHAILVGLIDDRLLAEHGIDRAQDPARAAAVLGPELHRFVANPPARRRPDAAALMDVVARIEAL